MLKLPQIKTSLKQKGWSYREAAKEIRRSYSWISRVLNQKATSTPVLIELESLPHRVKPKQVRRKRKSGPSPKSTARPALTGTARPARTQKEAQ